MSKDRIIITGASGGIGKYLFNHYTEKKFIVYGTYNKSTVSERLSNYHKVDLTNVTSVNEFVSKIAVTSDNRIALINCAGSNYNAFAHKADPIKWAELLQINLVGTFNIIQALLPTMREAEFGRIINFSSIVAQRGVAGTSAYAASKAGMWGMSKAIAIENASKGITINNLNLGYFSVGMIDQVPKPIQLEIKNQIPMKRFGDPQDILSAVEFLRINSYITGATLDINGGLV
jgi:acetoacetyl-CoA reductase/3-oxoacyl-[acyl-carrier protein] reductase